MLTRLKSSMRLGLALLVSLVLILQSAGASLAPCKLGVEARGCCGAHTPAAQPSCCGGELQEPASPEDGPGAAERDCTCELFGELPVPASISSSERAALLLDAELSMSACSQVIEAVGRLSLHDSRARPPEVPPDPRPGSRSKRCAELGSWRL